MAKNRYLTIVAPDFNIAIAPRKLEYVTIGKEQFIRIFYSISDEDLLTPNNPLLNENTRVFLYANFIDVLNLGGTVPEYMDISPEYIKNGKNWELLQTTKFPLVKNTNNELVPEYLISLNVTKYKGNFQIASYARNLTE
mgnify:CR=1 FL=1